MADIAKVVIKNLVIRGRHFTVVYNTQYSVYCAIEDKYIDADGTLNTTLNGLQMHASKDLAQCVEGARVSVEIDYLKEQGYTAEEVMEIMADRIRNGKEINA